MKIDGVVLKKVLVTVLITCFAYITMNFASGSDYSNLTKAPELQAALARLEAAHCYRAMAILNGQNPTRKPIRIMFRNLAVMGFGTCEAVTANTDKGLIIFIHSKHKNNAPEALACLIAHETEHNENTQTFEEELRAWNTEINTWNKMTEYNPGLKDGGTDLVKRLNYISKLYKRGNNSMSEIEGILAKNPAYSKLSRS